MRLVTKGRFRLSKAKIRLWELDPEERWQELVGQEFYLLYFEYQGWGHDSFYRLQREVPSTNRGIRRPYGWLGTTDNWYSESWGRVRVRAVGGRSVTFQELEDSDEA